MPCLRTSARHSLAGQTAQSSLTKPIQLRLVGIVAQLARTREKPSTASRHDPLFNGGLGNVDLVRHGPIVAHLFSVSRKTSAQRTNEANGTPTSTVLRLVFPSTGGG